MDAANVDARGHESGHLMLITPERVFYAGLLGRPRQRCSGAFHVYVAIEGGLRLAADGRNESYSELAVVIGEVQERRDCERNEGELPVDARGDDDHACEGDAGCDERNQAVDDDVANRRRVVLKPVHRIRSALCVVVRE